MKMKTFGSRSTVSLVWEMSFQEFPKELKKMIRSFNQHTPKQLKSILELEILYMHTLKMFLIIKNVLEDEDGYTLLMKPSAVVNLLRSDFYKSYNQIMGSSKKESNVWGFFRRIAILDEFQSFFTLKFQREFREWMAFKCAFEVLW